ncbi:L,D-transpeptidase [Streptomyces sp. NPDC048404]|uniref:L,D-transpeptidase n=1 Tax=unclassified Streptomyces TaxID=2593676 RepID=UPI00341F38A8
MSDELASALRELANEAARPPVLTGAEIRGRATGRRRRRRTALAAAGVSLAGTLALVVVGPDGGTRHEPSPAASPTVAPSLSAVSPDATIDLGKRVITLAGHRLTLHGDTLTGDTPTVRMTVTAKEADMRVSSETVGLDGGYFFEASWVVKLTGPDGRTDYVGSLASDQGISDPDHGWIALDMADAKLLYDRLERGAVVEIRPSVNASAS